MRKILLIFMLFVSRLAFGQPGGVDQLKTYEEAVDPSPDHSAVWNSLNPGLHASFGSVNSRYEKSSIPVLENNTCWKGFAWRGERLSAQLVLWNNQAAGTVECRFSDFKSANGKKLPANIARASFVRYVLTDEFGPGCGYRKPEDFISRLSPDALDPQPHFKMGPKSTRPVWISIDVPTDATPGIYTSTMQLMLNGKKHSKFSFNIEVAGRTLTPPSEWKFHLDLWQNPYSVARVHGVELWSAGHWKALYPVMKMLADAGQKVITATLNNRPWGGQTEDAYGSMIAWKKQADGNWSYDYEIFDQWVQFMMDLGIKAQINCYSMVPWGNELYYFDVASGKEIKISAEPGSKEYAEMWTPFLRDFVRHLDRKGWKDITRIAMDERSPAEMKASMKLLDEVAPDLSVAFADNHQNYKTFPDQLTDLCVAYGAVLEPEVLNYRKSKAYISTWYVCCSDAFPNVFTFSDPAEGTFIGWYTMAAGFDGFLRWAYNCWVKDPLVDSRFRTWPAGDTYIVYPDARSSIRFERLREGIQDAEKIRLLRDEFKNGTTVDAKEKLKKLNETVALFNVTKKPDHFQELIDQAKQTLEDLSR